jgi:HTH-type transcriptional regulator / antitoxin HipB
MRVTTSRELGSLVRQRRHDLRLTQQQLADRAGVGRPWLVAVEAGHPRAEVGKLFALLAELGLDLDLSAGDAPVQRDSAPEVVDLDELLGNLDAARRRSIP